MAQTRIIGIDPGSRITGIGVIDSDGRHNTHVYSTCVRMGKESFPKRLGMIYRAVTETIQTYQPQEMSIEAVFVSNNPSSALKLGQARGAAICAGVMSGMMVHEYSPKEVKQSVVGKGGADKQQVQHMVKILLNLSGRLQIDTSDALAVALSHAHYGAYKSKIAQIARS
ncbi:MAG: crossover junction endodeoxyribonuclease RuvC [Proteobacteria bacterium]|nr:MAG: crossover junction endodeoxyribonuclease RuvC [Pseudomonadota bacterium]